MESEFEALGGNADDVSVTTDCPRPMSMTCGASTLHLNVKCGKSKTELTTPQSRKIETGFSCKSWLYSGVVFGFHLWSELPDVLLGLV